MTKGIIEYNEDGNPKCEICGKYFTRVITHVRQKHNMLEREYKKRFGLDLKKGICSKRSSQKSRDNVIKNYSTCIKSNLIEKGVGTRRKKGDKGKTKDMVSEQTRIMLKKRLTEEYMIEKMKESGRKLGKSNIGNLVRWRKI